MEFDYSVKDEYLSIESRRGWNQLFMEIREKSANYSIGESKKVANRDLNRYRDVNPFDHSRIVLRRGSTSYINASLVTVQTVGRDYILTQGPLPGTVSHFWSMVWEQNCRAIVMLNNIMEKNQVKCHTYWPEVIGESGTFTLDDVQLTVQLAEEVNKTNYVVRTIRMMDMDNEEVRAVKQYHYTTWPDFGVPSTPSDFIQFLQDVRDSGGLGPGTEEEPIGPAVVHCSAGIGRSGTFCIVDTALLQLARGERINVKELVLEMRRYRMGLIQTAEQLRFSYQSIIQGAETLNIDLRRDVIAPYKNGNNGGSSTEDDDDDDSDVDDSDDGSDSLSISAEEVEEEDDVASNGSPLHTQIFHHPVMAAAVGADADPDEPPPPIPPRGESLACSPVDGVKVINSADYDRPLPVVPPRPKRSHGQVDASSEEDDTEDEPAGRVVADEAEASGSETERKRLKPDESATIPRAAESEGNGATSAELRQRRKEKTQQLITGIKERQKESEKIRDQARIASKWVGIAGLGLVVALCFGLRYLQQQG